jgi:hypothetical protein
MAKHVKLTREQTFPIYDFMKGILTTEELHDGRYSKYAPTWDDRKVAEHFGVSVGAIEHIRVSGFGKLVPSSPAPAVPDKRIKELEETVRTLEIGLARLTERLDTLIKGLGGLT